MHCADCYHPSRLHQQDDTKFPSPTRVAVTASSGRPAVRVDQLTGVSAHVDEGGDQFGVREQKEIAVLDVPAAGSYTVQVQLNQGYYSEPGAPAVEHRVDQPAPAPGASSAEFAR